MAKKKILLVETTKAGRNWSIKVSGQGEDLFQLFGSTVKIFADEKEVPIINASDPFPVSQEAEKERRRIPLAGGKRQG